MHVCVEGHFVQKLLSGHTQWRRHGHKHGQCKPGQWSSTVLMIITESIRRLPKAMSYIGPIPKPAESYNVALQKLRKANDRRL